MRQREHRGWIQPKHGAASIKHMETARQHTLHSPLHEHHSSAIAVMQCGHALESRIEGDLVEARGCVAQQVFIHASLAGDHQQGCLGRISGNPPLPLGRLDERRVVAQHASHQQFVHGAFYVGGISAKADRTDWRIAVPADLVAVAGCPKLAHRHLVFGQRAGLVRADHRRAAQRLDRRQAPHNRSPTSHPCNPDCKRHGDRRGQALGNGADRQRYRRHEHLQPVLAAQNSDPKGQRRQCQNDHQHHVREFRHGAGERRGEHIGLTDHARNASGLCALAGLHDKPKALARHDHGAREDHVCAISEWGIRTKRFAVLADRSRFAGQRGLGRIHRARIDDPQVGGHAISGSQPHQIARHQRAGVQPLSGSAAMHRGIAGHASRQRGERVLGPPLLDEAHQSVDQDHAHYDAGVDEFTEEEGNGGRRQQDVDQRLVHLQHEAQQRAPAGRRRQLVRTVGNKSSRSLFVAEAIAGVRSEHVDHIVHAVPMPACPVGPRLLRLHL